MRMEQPLTPQQFRSALHKGLGRAVIHVLEHGNDGICSDLLEACLHARSYDPQLEGSRAFWLLEMIEATGKETDFHDAILDALAEVEDGSPNSTWDAAQLCDFALYYARRGDQRANRLLYQVHRERPIADSPWLGARQILDLHGLEGLALMAVSAGERILSGAWVDASQVAYFSACEEYGRATVEKYLREAASGNAALEAFVEQEVGEDDEGVGGNPHVGRAQPLPFEVVLEAVGEARWEFGYQYRWFGKHADAAELRIFFDRLRVEKDPEIVLRCLWVFDDRELPEIAPRVFEQLELSDERLSWAAASALANTTHPHVRQAALAHLEEDSYGHLARGVTMLQNNYRSEDAAIIFNRLPTGESDSEEARERNHNLGWQIRELAEQHTDPALAPCLLWLYEYGPCSMCRTRAVRHLSEWNALSEAAAKECRLDAAEEIRELMGERA